LLIPQLPGPVEEVFSSACALQDPKLSGFRYVGPVKILNGTAPGAAKNSSLSTIVLPGFYNSCDQPSTTENPIQLSLVVYSKNLETHVVYRSLPLSPKLEDLEDYLSTTNPSPPPAPVASVAGFFQSPLGIGAIVVVAVLLLTNIVTMVVACRKPNGREGYSTLDGQ
jgi:hypothetical protein